MTRVARPLLATLLATLLMVAFGLLLGTGTAFAHNVLISSDPADGASLDSGPARAVLRFDLPVQPSFSAMTVVGPDGGHYEDGGATADGSTADGSTVSVAVHPLGPVGRYLIGYRVVSDDGHPVSGSVSFTLIHAGTGRPVFAATWPGTGPGATAATTPGATPGAAREAAQGGGLAVWPWVVGAVLLVGGGAALALRTGRS
ncbi:MAG: copper resistance protein CopC [Actinomycetota bacterium]|nr:copper resistance protein CopC [Actinomycetota bacterium]